MSQEAEVEELYDIIASNVDVDVLESSADTVDYEISGIRQATSEIIAAGYRRADEVRKETIKEISTWLHERYRAEFLGLFDKQFGTGEK